MQVNPKLYINCRPHISCDVKHAPNLKLEKKGFGSIKESTTIRKDVKYIVAMQLFKNCVT
jgi:hypothetical protein